MKTIRTLILMVVVALSAGSAIAEAGGKNVSFGFNQHGSGHHNFNHGHQSHHGNKFNHNQFGHNQFGHNNQHHNFHHGFNHGHRSGVSFGQLLLQQKFGHKNFNHH